VTSGLCSKTGKKEQRDVGKRKKGKNLSLLHTSVYPNLSQAEQLESTGGGKEKESNPLMYEKAPKESGCTRFRKKELGKKKKRK